MANEVVDHGRRRFLTATTAVVGGVGVVTAVVPFIKSWEPSARAKSAGAPVTIDISKIEEGQRVTYPWRGLPVFVVNRTKAQARRRRRYSNHPAPRRVQHAAGAGPCLSARWPLALIQ